MNVKKVFLYTAVTIAVCVGGAYFFISRTPRYAFYRVGNAIRTHDVELFTTYVDVDAVVDEWVVWGAKQAKEELLEMKSGLENPLGEGMIELMMPNLRMKLKEEFKRSLLENVETGTVTGGLPLLNMALLPIETIGVKDKVAEIVVKHPRKNEQIFFKLRFLPQGYWRIVSIQIPALMRAPVKKAPAHPMSASAPPRPSSPVNSPAPEVPAPAAPQPRDSLQVADLTHNAAASLQRDLVLTQTMIYAEYYQSVRDSIRKKISSYADKGYKGQVELQIVLAQDGKLRSVEVEKSKKPAEKRLRELAIKAAKEAAPYPPFPQELRLPEAAFQILISFE